MGVELKVAQNQKISQSVIQQMAILQMNGLELDDYMKDLSMENPLVELEEKKTGEEEEKRLEKLEWLSGFDEQNRIYEREDREDSDFADIFNIRQDDGETLEDILMMQVIGKHVSEGKLQILEYLIGNLDSRGYFVDSLEDVAVRFGVPQEEVNVCLKLLQSLEPAGIGARNLSECLLIQLEQKEEEEGQYQIEKEIIKNHLELLGKNHLEILSRKLDVSAKRLQEAGQVIRTLNPKPANGYGQKNNVCYVKPDVEVLCKGETLSIRINDAMYPELRVNGSYMRMLKSEEQVPEIRKYISEKVRQIEQVQGFISKRYDTLSRLTSYLVDHQEDFFRCGPGNLHPLKMQEMADVMGVHESTISRAVREKYLQCSWGVFPLDYFFSKAQFGSQNAQTLAVDQIKEKLRRMIEAEDKKKPLSDQKLADGMNADGIEISRRTIAKYRDEMEIPDCRGRKQIIA